MTSTGPVQIDRGSLQRRRRIPPQWVPWLVLLASLALTVAATASVAASAADRDRARFRNAVESAADRITGRLDVYVATLRAGAALFAASDVITQQDFSNFVERLEIQIRYPGIQGIGWSPRTAADPSGGDAERYEIRYIEPMDARNRAALGYDMYQEATRRAAMQRARDEGEPALSGRVTLVQEITLDQQAGFLLYLPIYRGGQVPATEAERRERLLGFIYSPFRANDLFRGIFGSEAVPRVGFSVYDGHTLNPDALLYQGGEPDHDPDYVTVQPMEIGGRVWTVVFRSSSEFEAGSRRVVVPSLALAGLIGSLLLFWLARGQTKARQAAEAASQAKSAFLASMSHELRTPLNAIGGYVDLMQMGIAGPVTETQLQYLQRVNRAQSHLLGLINDVLNFAKLEASAVSIAREPVRVAQVVDDAHSMISGLAETKGIRLTVDAGADVQACGDAEKIRQILLNLLSNAVKFTDAGGAVAVGWSVEDERVRLQVTDTGIGIPQDRLEEIFEPFVQVDTTTSGVRQGTGLGLSISRSLARAMDGDLTARSRPGQGSTFTLELPTIP